MSQKNKPALKAARRSEREAAKQNQIGSQRTIKQPNQMEVKSIKNNAADKKSFGDFTQEQLLKIPVRITFFSDLLLKDDAILEFETDMDRFLNTLLFCKSKKSQNPKISVAYYSVLRELFNSDAPFDEYMFTIGMHFLACLPCVEQKLRYGLQSLSFIVIIKEDSDHIDPFVQMCSYDEWLLNREKCIESMLNNNNNKNAA